MFRTDPYGFVRIVAVDDFIRKSEAMRGLAKTILEETLEVTLKSVVVLRMLAESAASSLAATEILVKHKFRKEALSMARSCFECVVYATYLRQHPGELDDYLDFPKVTRKLYADMMQRDESIAMHLGEEFFKNIDCQYDDIRSRFLGGGKEPRNKWHRVQIKQMANTEILAGFYKELYPLLSAASHNAALFCGPGAEDTADDKGGFALSAAVCFVGLCLLELNGEAGLRFDCQIKSLLQLPPAK